MSDADVIIVGAGPTGLRLAAELCLGGIRPLVLERRAHLDDAPKALGFNGQILQVLRYRGLLERFEAAAGTHVRPASQAPFNPGEATGRCFAHPPRRPHRLDRGLRGAK